MSCPNCGAETKPGQKFCATCGTALSPTSSPASEAPAPSAAQTERQASTMPAGTAPASTQLWTAFPTEPHGYYAEQPRSRRNTARVILALIVVALLLGVPALL